MPSLVASRHAIFVPESRNDGVMDILLFGIAREIVGASTIAVPAGTSIKNVADLRKWLGITYPSFKGLNALAIAVNKEYADDDQLLDSTDEIALIPPVSGG